MTRQVRLYEDDAKLIDFVLFTMQKTDKKKTFADIIRPALRDYYRDELSRVNEILDSTDEPVNEPKRRNRS